MLLDETTGLKYVGQTACSPEVRFVKHMLVTRNRLVSRRMSLVGVGPWRLVEVGHTRRLSTLKSAEAYFMARLETLDMKGFNQEMHAEPVLYEDFVLEMREVDLRAAKEFVEEQGPRSMRSLWEREEAVAEWEARQGLAQAPLARVEASSVEPRRLTEEEEESVWRRFEEWAGPGFTRTLVRELEASGMAAVDARVLAHNADPGRQPERKVAESESEDVDVGAALLEAVMAGDESAARGALERGAVANSEHLQWSVQRGDVALTHLLLRRGVEAGPCLQWRALVVAKGYGELDVVRAPDVTAEELCCFIANHTMRQAQYTAPTSQAYEKAAQILESSGRAKLAAHMRRCKKRFDALALPGQRRAASAPQSARAASLHDRRQAAMGRMV